MARWFESGNFVWLSPVPILALVNAVALWRAVMKRADYLPFILALTFVGLGFMDCCWVCGPTCCRQTSPCGMRRRRLRTFRLASVALQA